MSVQPILRAAASVATRAPCSTGGRARRGVLLLNLGTPDRPNTTSVRRYLREFLSDPEVIRLPPAMRWFNLPLAAMIALFRSPQSAEAYRSIWTDAGSPFKVITEQQVAALESRLPGGWSVFYAMRYGQPSVAEALRQITAAEIDDLVVVPMYPQFSGPTTGTALDDLYQHLRTHGRRMQLTVRNAWHDDAGYIEAQARLIHEFSEERSLDPRECVLLFSAHSMPESYIRAGDPYQQQILHSVDLIAERLGWPRDRMQVAYQSKLGPVPWLRPSTEQAIIDLAAAGEPNVLVCPISFTADCLETLEEIGIRYRKPFETSGGRLHLCPALNTSGPFIEMLSRLVLRGVRRLSSDDKKRQPLIRPTFDATRDSSWIDSLVMVGTSLPARLGNGVPRVMEHVTPEQFRGVKRPQEEVPQLLRDIRESGELEECWIWNTCSRFELYGWVPPDSGVRVANAMAAIAGDQATRTPLNILRGRDALHHLLRTAAGLNSGLPGDGEVVGQMEVALELARRCEAAGARAEHLRDQVLACLEQLGKQTTWDDFRPQFCTVALKRVALDLDLDWTKARCVIIGTSVTAVSSILALRQHFGVPAEHLTVAYRNHRRGKLMKRMRSAIAGGTRMCVESYADERLQRAIADTDVIIFAIDRRVPILDRGMLTANRDLDARPVTIIDFNTFGSTDGLDGLDGLRMVGAAELDNAVAEFSDSMLDCPVFVEATQQVEGDIRHHLCRLTNGCPECGPSDEPLARTDGTPTIRGPKFCPSCPRRHALATCPQRLMTERIAS